MKLIFLGTGTSVGIPAIGCDCPVCTSGNPRNRRRRTSLYLEAAGTHVLVDTAPDFREQVLEYKVPRVDAVLITHAHADHIFGFDDIRRYNTIQGCRIPVYGSPEAMADMRRVFGYAEKPGGTPGVFRPHVTFEEIDGPFSVGGVSVEPFDVTHGETRTLGFLFGAEGKTAAYFPDCRRMGDDVVASLEGIDVMILDALKHKPHTTHLSLGESVDLLKRIGAGQSYIVHMCHDIDHDETEQALPDNIHVSYDGLALEL